MLRRVKAVNINPFREGTSMFLGSAFVGLIGLATILVLLNVATNISLIADAKIIELKLSLKRNDSFNSFGSIAGGIKRETIKLNNIAIQTLHKKAC